MTRAEAVAVQERRDRVEERRLKIERYKEWMYAALFFFGILAIGLLEAL